LKITVEIVCRSC